MYGNNQRGKNMFKNGELIIDNFAGGGGASTGIEAAFKDIYVDFAANHDDDAIRMHKVNHPKTIHLKEDIWLLDPLNVTKGRPVGLLWASPDCTHFSNTAGKRPLSHHIRGLAWNICKWAAIVRPRVIIMENVPEFLTWGPLTRGKHGYYDENGTKKFRAGHRPIEKKKGTTFKQFHKQLTELGYDIDYRTLCAADYGAPTIRERFFLIARCDGQPIEWPTVTHGERHSAEVKRGKLKPYTPATSVINYNIAGPSVFEMRNGKYRYGEKAMNRIYTCIQKYIIEEKKPNILPNRYNGHLQIGLITEEYGASKGFDPYSPMHTITKTAGAHFKDIRVILKEADEITLFEHERKVSEAMFERFGDIVIGGKRYQIADILGRNLMPHEMFKAQGFPENYIIDQDAEGNVYSKTAQSARVGNSVVPLMAKLLVSSNFPEFAAG